MPNRGIKAKLGQPIHSGRPAGVFKNPIGVPAQQYYKYLRHQASEGKLQVQAQVNQQAIQQQKQQWQSQHSPTAFERRASFMSDITNDGSFNY